MLKKIIFLISIVSCSATTGEVVSQCQKSILEAVFKSIEIEKFKKTQFEYAKIFLDTKNVLRIETISGTNIVPKHKLEMDFSISCKAQKSIEVLVIAYVPMNKDRRDTATEWDTLQKLEDEFKAENGVPDYAERIIKYGSSGPIR